MIKYIITKDIEVEESYFESEQIGVFDTEKEAISFARRRRSTALISNTR